jgi:hypothetical protein
MVKTIEDVRLFQNEWRRPSVVYLRVGIQVYFPLKFPVYMFTLLYFKISSIKFILCTLVLVFSSCLEMIMFKNPSQAFNNQKDTMTDILHPTQDLPPCFATLFCP